ncbi:hypothetical protein TanjilG_01874 [Lupinus angustifolius]|uniref:EF-hand domain-containing protein n=1 Tax=Lupinus angustifolius TaxID=3871 RepID=A0A1J7HUZ8_LUPAN|nr:PREDICTED: probable calcium-binding protein CML44 [Lupinus angustifolius]OIW16635.1 hypothetical protein TanjilG_01874 [Lupinus angustifolius]
MCLLTTNDLERIFEKLDMNGDGYVSIDELKWFLEKTGFKFSIEELESLVGKKSFDFNEFMFFYNSILIEIDEEVESDLVKAFKVFDLDGDGFITSQELECVLKRLGLWNGKDCKNMISYYDTNLDGQLDFEEFKNMMVLTTTSLI